MEKSTGIVQVREVYSNNVMEEFTRINSLIDSHPIIAIDTEFPGVILKSGIPYHALNGQQTYQVMKANVECTHLIQLGLTMSNLNGDSTYTWQFCFKDFNIYTDPFNPDSIQLLTDNGINFHKNLCLGIDSSKFVEVFIRSGLLSNPTLTWVTFHGAYDFGYLAKLLCFGWLPDSLEGFLYLLKAKFGVHIYDLKQMMLATTGFSGGLEKLARSFGVARCEGLSHQAGSDSLLTALTYARMATVLFSEGEILKHMGNLFGLDLPCYRY